MLTQLPTALGSPLPASRSKQSSCEAAKLRSATQRLSLEFNVTNTLWYFDCSEGHSDWFCGTPYWKSDSRPKKILWVHFLSHFGKKKKKTRSNFDFFFFFYFLQHTACHLTLTLTFIISFEKINSARLAYYITRTVHHTYVIHSCWSNHRLTPPQDTWASVHIYGNELEEFKLSFKTNWCRCQ